MILHRIRTAFRGQRTLIRRYSSEPAALYPPKVRAYPFVFDKDEAIRRMGVVASFAAVSQGLWGSLAARYLPSLGFQAKQPDSVAAVYLPGWIIDGEVEAAVYATTRSEEEAKRRTLLAQFRNSYMPGFAYEPLSRVSFKDEGSDKPLQFRAVPWEDDLKNQHGLDVLCIPYTVTPFALPDAARTLSFTEAHISENFRFDPTSVNALLIAAFPVLIPVYLLKYHTNVPNQDPYEFSIILDASTPDGRVIMNNYMTDYQKIFPDIIPQEGIFAEVAKMAVNSDFLTFDRGSSLPSWGMSFANISLLQEKTKHSIMSWIDDKAMVAGNMEKYQKFEQELRQAATGSPDIDWNDVRIREYNSTEKDAFTLYMDQNVGLRMFRSIQKRLSQMNDDSKVVSLTLNLGDKGEKGEKSGVRLEPTGELMKDTQAREKEILKLKEELKPEWVREWEAQQKPRETETKTSSEPEKSEKPRDDKSQDSS